MVNGSNVAPYREYFVDIENTGTHDFHVPDTHYAVHVADAESGQPIANAEVAVINNFVLDSGGQQRATLRVSTNDAGDASLPPLRTGSVVIVGRAKGYRDADPVTATVASDTDEHRLSVQLRPEAAETAVSLLAPNGQPAAAAEVIAVPANGQDVILWRGGADDTGVLQVPRRLQGALLIARHATGVGLHVFDTAENLAWQLQPLAAPLIVKATDAAGVGAAYADVTLWLNDMLLQGNALRFLTGTMPYTDKDGIWRATLGPATLEILVAKPNRGATLRALAQQVVFPWPNVILVRAIN